MSETPDQRTSRLQGPANEPCATDPEREACLEQMSLTQQMGVTHEALDQRETCLKQVSLVQQRRLIHEIPEETATRCGTTSTERVTGDKESNSLFIEKLPLSSSSSTGLHANVLHA